MRDVTSLTFGSTAREASRLDLDRQMDRLPRIHIHTELISAKQSFRLSHEGTKE